ncbi:MAG TPA: glycogen debranching protein GlgX [Verrucomicrobiae bacterium]
MRHRELIEKNITLGIPYPLGATLMEGGVNFALFSANATKVELCLFDQPDSPTESRVIELPGRTNQIWHVFVPDLAAGQCYGYRVHGPYEPSNGHRFNPSKLLLDPYAKAIAGDVMWSDELFGYSVGGPDTDLVKDERNSAPFMPKCVVIDPSFDWEGDKLLRTPMDTTIIYETHVKGFSKLWPAIPERLRGTYAGLGCPEAVEYFKKLGVTAVELLPVHHHIGGRHLHEKGLTDYWGYNSIGFLAPDSRYSSSGFIGQQVAEFKTMVKNLHAAGLEVILDVVYNHTPEGNNLGPTFCFKGIDNSYYYRMSPEDPRYYMDYTGTGNTLAVYLPNALQLVMDSLRYWITEMHVDGFRFDLAASLARELSSMNRLASFFDVIHQDPTISQVKLIAEPWDIGHDGYQVGKFPVLWSEWNGKYRDTIRRYWKSDPGCISELASRLAGSADIYEATGKTPSASINFITSHDGFTLSDLVSYQETHNDANGEENRDGDKNNNAWNCGAEGPTDDPEINRLRRRQRRNLLATMFLSQGVPMLTAGDEYGRSQQGNNNAYCQDNEINWMNWNRDEDAEKLTKFVQQLIQFRKEHPVFRRLSFFRGRPLRGTNVRDVKWLSTRGRRMTDDEWNGDWVHCLGMFLSGYCLDAYGNPVQDDFFLLCLNAYHDSVEFTLPAGIKTGWELLIDTSMEEGFLEKPTEPEGKIKMEARSLCLLRVKPSEGMERESFAERLVLDAEKVEKQTKDVEAPKQEAGK